MSKPARRRLVWGILLGALLGVIGFDVAMTHRQRGFIILSPAQATGTTKPVVALASSQDLSPARALNDSTLTYQQVKDLVYLALDRDQSSGRLSATIKSSDWVAIKVNMVAAPIIDNGTKVGSFWVGQVNGVPHWGCVSDLRVTKALVSYLVEHVKPRRISIVEGSGEVVRTGSPYYPSYPVDGWTVTWDAFDSLSYQGIVNAINAAQTGTTVDIVDLNDDDPVLTPVPGGGLQLLGGSKRNWGYEDFIPGYGTPRGSWYMPRTLLEVDKVIDQATLKTTSPGITVFLKNYVGAVSMRGYGTGPGKSSVIDGVAIMAGYMDLVRIRPPDYCLAAGFWSSDGWYGGTYDINHNVVIAGQNVVAAEAVAARVMGYNPRDLQQLYLAHDVGLGSYDEYDYQVTGGNPAQLVFRFPGNANFKPSGFQQYVMLGPFNESDITVDLLGGEAGATGAPGQTTAGQTWWIYGHRPGYPEPYTDFSHLGLGSLNGKTLYAYLELQSNGAQDGYLRFGSDGPARVWVNGVLSLSTGAASAYSHRAGVIHLQNGTNPVLVKVVGTAAGGGFALSLTDGSRMLTEIYPLPFTNAVLAAPFLSAFGGAITYHGRPTLDWSDVSGATSYTLELADNWGFAGATTISGLTSSEHTFHAPLADGTYYWRVKAVAGATESAWSATDSLSIIPALRTVVLVILAATMAAYMLWRPFRRLRPSGRR